MLSSTLLTIPLLFGVRGSLANPWPQSAGGSTTATAASASGSSSAGGSGGDSGASNVRITYYNTEGGYGACGSTLSDDMMVVAMNADQYQAAWCGKTITITVNGVSAQGVIQDKCPGCPSGGLDLTPTLFQKFGDLGTGVLTGSWTFGGDSSGSSNSSAAGGSGTAAAGGSSTVAAGGSSTAAAAGESSTAAAGGSSSAAQATSSAAAGGGSTTAPGSDSGATGTSAGNVLSSQCSCA